MCLTSSQSLSKNDMDLLLESVELHRDESLSLHLSHLLLNVVQ